MNISLWNKNKKTAVQFVKFMAVGVMNFIVDFGIFTLLSAVFGVPVVISKIISYPCGVVNSFLVNRYWTFKIKYKFVSVHFLKFVFVNLISYGVNVLAVWILVELYGFSSGLFGINNLYANLIATVFSFTVNFAGNKLLVFREEKAAEKE
jgi:putative flippase GtrA